MSKSISEIKIEFEQAGEQQWEALCQEYETDSRTGVKNLTARYRKKQQALVQERERLEVMKRSSGRTGSSRCSDSPKGL